MSVLKARVFKKTLKFYVSATGKFEVYVGTHSVKVTLRDYLGWLTVVAEFSVINKKVGTFISSKILKMMNKTVSV